MHVSLIVRAYSQVECPALEIAHQNLERRRSNLHRTIVASIYASHVVVTGDLNIAIGRAA